MKYDLRQELGPKGWGSARGKKVEIVEAIGMTPRGEKFSSYRSNSTGQSAPDGADNYKNLVGMVGTVKDNFFHFKREDQDEGGQGKWDKLLEYGVSYTSRNGSSRPLLSEDYEEEADGLKIDLEYLSKTTLHILVKLVGDIESTQARREALAAELFESGMHQSPSGGGKRRRKSKKKSKKRRKSKRKSKRRKSTKRKSKRR